MTATTNLLINHVEANQNQKTVTINEATDIFDGAVAGLTLIDISGLAAASPPNEITPDEDTLKRTLVIKASGAMDAAVDLIVPTTFKHAYWVIHNGTGFDLTIKTAAGTGPTISPTEAQMVYADGTDVLAISSSGSGGATQATEKSEVDLSSGGGLVVVPITPVVTVVDKNTVELFASGIRLRRDTEYTVTESVPASGFDQLTPSTFDVFGVSGAPLTIKYYIP